MEDPDYDLIFVDFRPGKKPNFSLFDQLECCPFSTTDRPDQRRARLRANRSGLGQRHCRQYMLKQEISPQVLERVLRYSLQGRDSDRRSNRSPLTANSPPAQQIRTQQKNEPLLDLLPQAAFWKNTELRLLGMQ